MATKYVAAQDFDDYQAGDAVAASEIGDRADALLAAGKIRERDAGSDAAQPSDPAWADPRQLMVAPQPADAGTPSVTVAAAAPAPFVTLAASQDGMPRFQTVTPEERS